MLAGARYVRIPCVWEHRFPTEPTGIRNPGSYGAMFVPLDTAVRRFHANGLKPILSVYVPEWAMAPSRERPSGWGRRPIP